MATVTESDAVEAIVSSATARRGHWTVTANLDHLRRYRRDDTSRRIIDAADLVLADGTPLVWASHIAGTPLPQRVAGSDMIWSICEAAGTRQVPIYLLGGAPGMADQAAEVLRGRYNGLQIAGTLCPPMGFEKDERELERIQHELEAAAPQIVLVGLGFPKQDLLIVRLRQCLPEASFIGVGISFSFVAGALSRAPRWMHRLGVEWLYRMLHEPSRLVRRYLVDGLPFALLLFASATHHRLLSSDSASLWGEVSDES